MAGGIWHSPDRWDGQPCLCRGPSTRATLHSLCRAPAENAQGRRRDEKALPRSYRFPPSALLGRLQINFGRGSSRKRASRYCGCYRRRSCQDRCFDRYCGERNFAARRAPLGPNHRRCDRQDRRAESYSGEGSSGMTMRTLDVLRLLGFSEPKNSFADLVWNFGIGEVSAVECVAEKGLRVYMSGFWQTKDRQRMGLIEYAMLVEVDSLEQGKAFVAYVLHDVHHVPFRERPSWIDEGLALKHLLPWPRSQCRFTCSVPQKFLRVALTDLRRVAKSATESDLVTFEFDGRVLTLTATGKRTEIVAGGQAWDRPYSVPLIQFRRGIRLNRNELAISIGGADEVAISIYDTRLQIHRNGFSFSEPAGPSA